MWFKLQGDKRLGCCTTDDCCGQPTWRLESGGIGSDYCSGCKEKISHVVEPRCDCSHLFEICNAPNCPNGGRMQWTTKIIATIAATSGNRALSLKQERTMKAMSLKKLSTPPVIRHDLKVCPFCGGSPEIEYWHGGGPNKRMIACRNDDCDVSPGVTGENERAAIAKWERRA